jgi:glycosidase
MGYDIADYREIDPRYGSVNDIEILIAKLKEHGIKLLMDLVVNHSSDQHAWFEESRSSKTTPKRDWCVEPFSQYLRNHTNNVTQVHLA